MLWHYERWEKLYYSAENILSALLAAYIDIDDWSCVIDFTDMVISMRGKTGICVPEVAQRFHWNRKISVFSSAMNYLYVLNLSCSEEISVIHTPLVILSLSKVWSMLYVCDQANFFNVSYFISVSIRVSRICLVFVKLLLFRFSASSFFQN